MLACFCLDTESMSRGLRERRQPIGLSAVSSGAALRVSLIGLPGVWQRLAEHSERKRFELGHVQVIPREQNNTKMILAVFGCGSPLIAVFHCGSLWLYGDSQPIPDLPGIE